MEIQTYRWQKNLRKWAARPGVRQTAALAAALGAGFCLSAASLANAPQPLCLAVLCAGLPGWLPLSFALGASGGYWIFWGQAGAQGLIWVAAGLSAGVLLHRQQAQPLLMPGLAGLITASVGLIFQLWQGEQTPIALYLLRIGLAFGTTWLIPRLRQRREGVALWLALGIGVLALAQIAPAVWLNFGVAAAGLAALTAPFPGAAMAGLALDLAGVSTVPMTAVLCLSALVRLIPRMPKKMYIFVPGAVYLAVMALCGSYDFAPLPALTVGALCAQLSRLRRMPVQAEEQPVCARLEAVSQALAQGEQILRQVTAYPLDAAALVAHAADRACTGCEYRGDCRAAERVRYLPQTLLHQAQIAPEHLPGDCKRKGRLLVELRRGQEQYRTLIADRMRQQEYRGAVAQQYGFLSEYLRSLSDELLHAQPDKPPRFRAEVAVCARGKETVNGDRCFWFAGTQNRYYVLLCDGMGTGESAEFEARTAGEMLRRLLSAGCPAQRALQSLNDLCILRSSAGAVTVDLAEADLTTGRTTVYKWGAAPSWLLEQAGAQRIGRGSPPPGIALEGTQASVERVAQQDGTPLVLLSDGVDGVSGVAALDGEYSQPAGFLAALILEGGCTDVPDDGTAAVLRLHPVGEA